MILFIFLVVVLLLTEYSKSLEKQLNQMPFGPKMAETSRALVLIHLSWLPPFPSK
jgi:hypothetical protein